MQEKIKDYLQEIESFSAGSKDEIENFRIKYLGKKGILAELFAGMKNIEPANRKEYGHVFGRESSFAIGCLLTG